MSPHVSDRLSPFADGELTPEERGAVEAHLRDCVECAQELSELLAVDAMARDLPLAVPAGYFDSFPARVRGRLKSRPVHRVWPRWAWAAAAALVLGVLTPLTLRERRVESPAAPAREAETPTLGTRQGSDSSADRETRSTEGQRSQQPPHPAEESSLAKQRLKDAQLGEERTPGKAAGDLRPATIPADTRAALEKEKDSFQAAAAPKAAATPLPPLTLATHETAASPAPRETAGEFAAPPPAKVQAEAPPASVVAKPKARPPAARGGSAGVAAGAPFSEQHGPRAQAQAPPSSPEPQAPPAEDVMEAQSKRRVESVRQDQPADEGGKRSGGAEAKKLEERRRKNDEEAEADRVGVAGIGNVSGTTGAAETRYRSLVARPVQSAAAARELREAWRGFLTAFPGSPWADEARVRIVEASTVAWHLGYDPADRQAARRDGEAYLLRADALQKDRVRAVLAELAH